ncbi:hypothetical protein KAR91_39570 [Candidatus Pacearchaeota archaeon]|nr:hypothetical protein [Candidatus Pacearchaeota archaeon]
MEEEIEAYLQEQEDCEHPSEMVSQTQTNYPWGLGYEICDACGKVLRIWTRQGEWQSPQSHATQELGSGDEGKKGRALGLLRQ